MTADRISDHDQFGWNLGYIAGEQERVALAAANSNLRAEVAGLLAENKELLIESVQLRSRAIRYVKAPANLTEVAHRGVSLFGKAWMEVIGITPTPPNDKDAT